MIDVSPCNHADVYYHDWICWVMISHNTINVRSAQFPIILKRTLSPAAAKKIKQTTTENQRHSCLPTDPYVDLQRTAAQKPLRSTSNVSKSMSRGLSYVLAFSYPIAAHS